VATTPAEALRVLREAAEDGRLEALVRTRELTLVTVFGSVVDDPANAKDIDIAVAPRRGTSLDLLAVINDLMWLTGSDDVDLLDLGRAGPVARQHALTHCIPLYESEPGEFARAQLRANMDRMDTERFREHDLRLMAESAE
jgi:predicted nucleotidyltransferase